jgi:RNA polymerase sigma factor (sigma-70 family)
MKSPLSSEHAAPTPARSFDFEDDARLVKECLRGEQAAWSELLWKYKNLIFSIPIKRGFSHDDAADIFQSVCLDLVNELSNLREPRALAAWLIRITHNKCSHSMKDKRRFGEPEENRPEPALPAEAIPENLLRELEKEQALRTGLRALNPRCQRLVQMLFFETPPRPYQEIAKSLTLATGSLGFIRARCLEKLREKLEEIGFA